METIVGSFLELCHLLLKDFFTAVYCELIALLKDGE